ncbi:LOW QUALITY PROTEIN: Gag protein [Phytophthora palmivora]|uniref:Gag protein n=1 Tax=Phytophthora palmivora TaxID=4796 RepID=A0A2P4YNC0_9STRA|nr:LOW QUALITY PROTEIN: Gag protein [Phytophthora palmivora]
MSALWEGKGTSLPNLGARGGRGRSRDPRARGTGVTSRGGAPYWGRSKSPWSADGARHGGLAPESLGALETRKSSGRLLVVHASVRGYEDPFRVLIDSGASTNFARCRVVARNGDRYADALRESKGRGQASVRLADGTVVNVPGIRVDLAVKFEDFDSTESFLVLDMDKYELILGMPWLERHESWIDWRGKAIGASRHAVSDRALVSNVPTFVQDRGARKERYGAYAPEEVLGVTDSSEGVAMSLATGHDTKAHCQASPQMDNVVPQTGEAVEEDAESASNVGKIVPRKIEETEKKIESTACVCSVGNEVPRGVKKTGTRAEESLSTSRVDKQGPHSESETLPA